MPDTQATFILCTCLGLEGSNRPYSTQPASAGPPPHPLSAQGLQSSFKLSPGPLAGCVLVLFSYKSWMELGFTLEQCLQTHLQLLSCCWLEPSKKLLYCPLATLGELMDLVTNTWLNPQHSGTVGWPHGSEGTACAGVALRLWPVPLWGSPAPGAPRQWSHALCLSRSLSPHQQGQVGSETSLGAVAVLLTLKLMRAWHP